LTSAEPSARSPFAPVGATGTGPGATGVVVPDGRLGPFPLNASTVKEYETPVDSPVTVHVSVVVAVHDFAGVVVAVATYFVIFVPFVVGWCQMSWTEWYARSAMTPTGGEGTVFGTMFLIPADGPGPYWFTAATVTKYAVPFCRTEPVSVWVVCVGFAVAVNTIVGLPEVRTSASTTYLVIRDPPSLFVGIGSHFTVIEWFVVAGVPFSVGATNGADTGVTAADGNERGLVPLPFVATTVKVYVVPLVNPSTVHWPSSVVVSHVFAVGVDVAV
jgi:hypothetical protein